ncbi:MAG: hypothetical protein JNM68_11055 [Dinghuibacter sp.]|nr:hypothetical protein [Dinghuibacter sp.]
MPARRKILVWGAALAASLSAFRFLTGSKKTTLVQRCDPSPEPETVKMLTQDGQLVEIDKKLLAATPNSKITNEELQQWIKK